MNASETIKKLRIALNLNKSEFAKLLNIDRSAVSNYECGARFPRTAIIREMLAIAKKNRIKITFEDFFREE